MLILAIVLITSALVFYTAGVWAERRSGSLTWGHVALFAAGLTFDATGTTVMSRIAAAGTSSTGLLSQIMVVTGALALVLMAGHLAWALIVMWRDRPSERLVFHKLSLAVWGIWLLPYVTGMLSSAI